MALPAEKLSTLEALRSRIAERFRGTVPQGGATPSPGPALASGWPAVDGQLLLRPGDMVTVHAPPGAGGLALASAWAQAAVARDEPVLVVDAEGSSLPHPWVTPAHARAPLWVVVPPRPVEAWPAVDIGLRSGAFGLVVLLDPPPPPRGAGPRLTHLARTRQARLVLSRWRRWPSGEGLSLGPRLHLQATRVDWAESPMGAAPTTRVLEVRLGTAGGVLDENEVMHHDEVRTDRLRPSPRAADRRPSHGRGRSRYDT
jgi:hypothetical protein